MTEITGHPLEGFILKMNRAEKHLRAIKDAIATYGETDFCEISTELDYKRRPTARFRNVVPPDPAIAVLIGDCVHNFRSGLDHLAYQLALGHSGALTEGAARDVAFPIFDSGPKFRGEKGRGAQHKMKGMSRFARGAIERVQPYHRRKHPELWALWLLDEMWQVDKHRLVHVTGAVPAGGKGYIENLNVQQVGIQQFVGPIQEGAIFKRLLGDFPRPAEVKMNSEITPDIAFDKRTEARSVRGLSVVEVIEGIRSVIGFRVLAELDRELHRLFPSLQLRVAITRGVKAGD